MNPGIRENNMKKLIFTLVLLSALGIIFLLADRKEKTDIIVPAKKIHRQEIKNKHKNIKKNQKVKIKTSHESKKNIKFQNCGPDSKCNKKNKKINNEETNDLEILGSGIDVGL